MQSKVKIIQSTNKINIGETRRKIEEGERRLVITNVRRGKGDHGCLPTSLQKEKVISRHCLVDR